ncbi:MAG: hydantoinase/oxoprolinase family protein [Acidobacteriota bacterium]
MKVTSVSNSIRSESDSTDNAPPAARIGLGIDAGGTYTDAVVYDLSENRLLAKNKALTTKWNFVEGVDASLRGLNTDMLRSADLVALSTTLATNAIVEERGQKVGLLFMPPYGLFEPDDIPYEPKARISGRLEITGEPIEPGNESEIVSAARQMVDQLKVGAFAVSGFAGTINPEHELEVKRILRRETGLDVCCGHELSDILNFRTRAYTAIMNGRIIPLLTKLLSDVREVLRNFNIRAPLAVVRGDGTLMSSEAAREKPVETILSGPAASVAGARHLTGRKDAIVVDMGGTTTDAAILSNGRVSTSDGGSNVGGHKTHVRALQVRTLGLGGDSFIVCKGGAFQIGPQRVVPVALLGTQANGVDEALDYYRKHPNLYLGDTRRLQLLSAHDHRDTLELTDQEHEILSLLRKRVYGPRELAECLGMSYWNPRITLRLEEHFLVQRCGFTPTDVLNCRGETALWDTKASREMCGLLGDAAGMNPVQLVDELKREIVGKFALVLFKRQLDEHVDDAEKVESCSVCMELVHNILGGNRPGYELSLKMHVPVVGIGTPVRFFLPDAAKLLQAEAVTPEHEDVANAVGAVTSNVVVRRRVEIRAYREMFRIEGLPGSRQFSDFAAAKAWAESNLVELVREIARNSGTLETDVKVRAEDKVCKTHTGKQLFLGCSLIAELQGRPVGRRFEQSGLLHY